MPILNNIKAIFFDLDETLLHQNQSFAKLLLATANEFQDQLAPKTPKDFVAAFKSHSNDMWHMMGEGVLDGDTARRYAFRNTLRELGVNLDLDEPLRQLSDTNIVAASAPFEDTFDTLTKLRDTIKCIGIVTNGFSNVQHRKIERTDLATHVDFVITSEEAGAHKPNPRIFEKALALAATSPENTLFVGDLLSIDILGADALGMKTVHIDPKNVGDKQRAEFPDLPIPTHTISNLSQLRPLLNHVH